jgi:hypothetical protein
MYAEENSKLISELYNAKTRQEVSDILEYVGESGDPIFVYPLLDGYRKYKQSSVGYYFIWNLSRLDYPELGQRLNELLESYEIEMEHLPMALLFLAERRYSSQTAGNMATMYFEACTDPEFRQDFSVNALGIGCVLYYLSESGRLPEHEKKLKDIFLDKEAELGDRALAMCYTVDIDPEKGLEFLIERFEDTIRGTVLEKHVLKRLLLLQTAKAKELKRMIRESGQAECLEILEKCDCPQSKKKEEPTLYNNIDITLKIGIMREQINKKTLVSEHFGFRLFPANEMLIYQGQSMDDKGHFICLCRDLLAIARDINSQVRSHNLSDQEKENILKSVPQEKRDWNVAHMLIFLHNRNVGVDEDIFGLRPLNRMLEIMIEDKQDKEFFSRVESFGIADLYRKGQWHKIHNVLTNSYLQALDTMNKTLSQHIRQDF